MAKSETEERIADMRREVDQCRLAVANNANPALFDHEEVAFLLSVVDRLGLSANDKREVADFQQAVSAGKCPYCAQSIMPTKQQAHTTDGFGTPLTTGAVKKAE